MTALVLSGVLVIESRYLEGEKNVNTCTAKRNGSQRERQHSFVLNRGDSQRNLQRKVQGERVIHSNKW